MRNPGALIGGALMVALAVSAGAQTPLPRIDERPVAPVSFVDLAYPPAALDARVKGSVIVQFTTSADGHVANAIALAGPPELTPAALANVRQWVFPMGERTAVVVYRFDDAEGECNDDRRSLFQLKYGNLAIVTACVSTGKWAMARPRGPWLAEYAAAVYPPIAVSARVRGIVVLELTLRRDGRVSDTRVLIWQPWLGEAAVKHARSWRFTSPGTPPRTHIVVYEFSFDYDACNHEPPSSAFWRTDSQTVHMGVCSPVIDVSGQPRPKP